MIIQHNMLAMNNLYMGKQIQKSKTKNLERLASGYRINRAADNAANMAISEKMQSRIRALARCQNNIEEGISLTQTADGALNEVNEMLNRVNELCVQAANGTNTADDRSKIAEEITQIYDDMDRIFEDTEFNTMKVFRHDGDNYYGPDPEYLYHESVTELPPGDLHSWGAGMFPTKQFDLAKPATAATATMTLGDGVDLANAGTLNGTSFTIKKGSTSYNYTFGDQPTSYLGSNSYYINTTGKSVQSVLNTVNSYCGNVDKVSISGNKVTFTFPTSSATNRFTYKKDTNNDGIEETISVEEPITNGATGNGWTVSGSNTSLDPIGNTTDITYSQTATHTFKVLSGRLDGEALAATPDELIAFRENMAKNTLYLSPNDTLSFSSLDGFDTIQTVGELRQKIADAIDDKPNFSATYDSTSGEIAVTIENLPADKSSHAYIIEETEDTIVDNITSVGVTLTVTSGPAATSESQAVHTIDVPSFDKDTLYSFQLNGSKYLLFHNDKYKSSEIDTTGNYHSKYAATGSDVNAMKDRFLSMIRSAYGSNFNVTMDSTKTKITLTSKQLGDNRNLNITQNYSSSFPIKDSSEPITNRTGTSYYSQNYSVSMNLLTLTGDENNFDKTKLYGKGFMLNNKYYQFTAHTGDSSTRYNGATPIYLDSVSSYADLRNALSNATGFTATEGNTPETIVLVKSRSTTSSASGINFSDGAPTGTFIASVTSSGGAIQKNPQTEIDFSKYDMDNLDDLYGTGFRITCATCPGEFINIMFCHDKSELNYPPSFEYTDDDGNTNTIHNYMVELKDVTHGSQIAANIADQLKNDLDHFTEVKVSDTNPSILIAQDKRIKDQKEGRAQVMAGVYTNFLYQVNPEKLPNPDDKVGGGRKDTDAFYAYCMIYAGDTQEKPYIAVHLPHFSVENLKLEYPKQPWDSYEEITDVMKRSKNAAEVVSMARSKIGADQNRLEHAFDYAANAEEQIADADSRIKDTDMAEAVTTNAKLTILSNAQEAMLTQILDLPERILPLLQ